MLFAIIAISGCVGNNPQSGGLVIEAFEPDFTTASSGEPVGFTAKIKNVGSVEATEVHAELLNIDEIWNPGTETLPNEEECRYTSSGFNLLPPSPQHGTEGASHICTWDYIAPSLPKDFPQTYNPTLRVFYHYQSSVVKAITIVDRDEMKILEDQGSPLPAETKSITSSPVMVDVETRGPIRAFGESVTFPFTIKISNVGGGLVCKGECKKYRERTLVPTAKEWNRIIINIELGQDMSLTVCEPQMELDLFKGESNVVVCEVEASNIPPYQTQREIWVTSEYDYSIDKAIQIKVIGT